MGALDLSMRQRRLLFMLQGQTDFVTSIRLAEALNVSSRTIRNDIRHLNRLLAPYQATIQITQAKGVLLRAKDPARLRSFIRADVAYFMTRAERIRHLAVRLCTADGPLNLFDLEDELYVSRTALMSDLRVLKQIFSQNEPFIQLKVSGNEAVFEEDELKIRSVLLKLFHQDWDYDSEGNAFFGYHFLDEVLLKKLLKNTSQILYQYHIMMDDPTLVALELTLAIMHHRVQNGHPFPDLLPPPEPNTPAGCATEALFALMEAQTGLQYPASERARIYEFISKCFLSYPSADTDALQHRFIPATQEVAKIYFSEIREVFGVDFSEDTEFSRMLILFFHQVLAGNSVFFQQQDERIVKESLVVEYELAYLFQMLSPDYRGRRLTGAELCNLAICLSGALRQYLEKHPERKLRAVLFSHRSFASTWELKCRLESALHAYLELVDYQPVNYKVNYDFTGVDLIFSTVSKNIYGSPSVVTLRVNEAPRAGFEDYVGEIRSLAFRKLWPRPDCDLEALLQGAFWRENALFKDRFQIIRTMSADFIQSGIASELYGTDILEREACTSFAVRSGIVFLHTLLPARETRLSVMSLQNRLEWDEFRVNTVVMLMYTEEDRNLLFHMKSAFYSETFDTERLRELKTKEALLPYLLDCLRTEM